MNNIKRKITVYNKSMKRIAEFSNSTISTTPEAQKNAMVNPTVTMVSNGESKLEFEMLSNSEKWQSIKDPENIYQCGNKRYTALNKNSIVYNGDIVSVTLVETWYLLSRVFVQAHNVDSKVEALDEHTVKILPKTSSNLKLTVNGIAYEDSQVTDQRGVQMPRGSAGYALWAVLKGTDWKLGVCDVLPDGFDASKDYGTFNVESDMKSALENIQFIQSLYGGILVWDSINKTVSLRDETKEGSDFNTWKGYEIRKKKNLAEPPKITWDNDIITKAYPLGNGNLNIRKVNGGKSFVENYSYTKDVYEGYIKNPNIYYTGDEAGQKTLKFWADQQLEKICKPRKSIEYNIIDLRSTPGYEHETFDINDIVKAYYMDEGKEVFGFERIQELSYNYFFPSSDSTIVVGDKVSNKTEIFHQIYKKQKDSAPTDNNGNLSADDIYIEIPDFFLEDFGYLPDGFGYSSLTKITELHAYHEKKNADGIVTTEAAVRVVADDLKAQVETFTTFKKETDDKFVQSSTQITQISDELQAQITLEANHYVETTQGITNTNARIDLVANDLSAQISLEASHYQESINYTRNSVAGLRAYVDGDRAIATLNAAYDYTNQKTGEVSNSLAQFVAEANGKFATTSQISQFVSRNEMNGAISQSEARVKTYASQNFAKASIEAKVNNIGSVIEATSDGANFHIANRPSMRISLDYGGIRILGDRTRVTIDGSIVSIPTNVEISGRLTVNGKTVVTK